MSLLQELATIEDTTVFLDRGRSDEQVMAVFKCRPHNSPGVMVTFAWPLCDIVRGVARMKGNLIPLDVCRDRVRRDWIERHRKRYALFGLPEALR